MEKSDYWVLVNVRGSIPNNVFSFHLLCIVSRHSGSWDSENEAACLDCSWQPGLLSLLVSQPLEGRCKEMIQSSLTLTSFLCMTQFLHNELLTAHKLYSVFAPRLALQAPEEILLEVFRRHLSL